MSYAFRVYEIRASSGWKIKLLIQEVAGQARAIVWVRWVSYLALKDISSRYIYTQRICHELQYKSKMKAEIGSPILFNEYRKESV